MGGAQCRVRGIPDRSEAEGGYAAKARHEELGTSYDRPAERQTPFTWRNPGSSEKRQALGGTGALALQEDPRPHPCPAKASSVALGWRIPALVADMVSFSKGTHVPVVTQAAIAPAQFEIIHSVESVPRGLETSCLRCYNFTD